MFKLLTQIKAKSIHKCNFLKFIIAVTGCHSGYSLLEPKSHLRHWPGRPESVLSVDTHLTQWNEICATSERFVNSSRLFLSPSVFWWKVFMKGQHFTVYFNSAVFAFSASWTHFTAVNLTLKKFRGCSTGNNTCTAYTCIKPPPCLVRSKVYKTALSPALGAGHVLRILPRQHKPRQ